MPTKVKFIKDWGIHKKGNYAFLNDDLLLLVKNMGVAYEKMESSDYRILKKYGFNLSYNKFEKSMIAKILRNYERKIKNKK